MLIYTQMDPRGTAFMQALGLPFYFTAIVAGLAVSSWFPGAYFVTLFGTFFIYSFAYSKALHYFVRRLRRHDRFGSSSLPSWRCKLLSWPPRCMGLRPNNSFKPKPLRGSA